jgi:hypothetical protein
MMIVIGFSAISGAADSGAAGKPRGPDLSVVASILATAGSVLMFIQISHTFPGERW